MDQKQRDVLRAKIVAEERNKKYFKIGIIVGSVFLIVAIIVGVTFAIRNVKKEPIISPIIKNTDTCFPEFQNFVKTYGQDYSKCLVDFDFTEQYCGGFDPDAEGLSNINIMVILDSSGSMAELVGSQKRIDVAKKAISDFLTKMPQGVKTGLIVYGHKGSNSTADKNLSCNGVEEIVKLGENNSSNIISAMNSFEPKGWTPIAGSIDFAKNVFLALGKNDKNYLFLVSDGSESCGGNPALLAETLRLEVKKVKLHVIGFATDDETRKSLEKVADWGGGSYINAGNAAAISKVFNGKLLIIKRDCINGTFIKMTTRYSANNLSNLNCWLSAQEKEATDLTLNIKNKSFSEECNKKISDAVIARQNDFWNQKETMKIKNEEIYKQAEATYNKEIKDIEYLMKK